MNNLFHLFHTCLRTILLAALLTVAIFFGATYSIKAFGTPSSTLEITPDWVQVSSTPTFVLQNTCGDDLYLRSSVAAPPAGDIEGSFLVGIRDIWTQSIPTAELWWVRTKSRALCNVTIQEF